MYKNPKDLTPEDYSGSEAPRAVFCRLTDTMIQNYECIENRDVVDGMFVETTMPERFKVKADWKAVCKACPWHEF